MAEELSDRILKHVTSKAYQPQQPQRLAKELALADDEQYPVFRNALKQLMKDGRVLLGAGGSIVMPSGRVQRDTILGSYRHNRKGFGFVVPSDPESHEDLYIGEGDNAGAISGDVVTAKIISRRRGREGKEMFSGRIMEIVERTHKQFVGSLVKQGTTWLVMPDGNIFSEPIETPDAASRHIRPGTKVVVEITEFPAPPHRAQGVIAEVLGKEGEKDVDLKSVIITHNLPGEFPPEVLEQARQAIDSVDWDVERSRRLDLTGETIVTIDPDDAKDYDDAISLKRLPHNQWELGVHIADVARFVTPGSPLDIEGRARGNSTYFPGFVIPMLPEVLSNGICSLQEGTPRMCKSVSVTLDAHGTVLGTRYANTLIQSTLRMRYQEAQAIIDKVKRIPHPDGEKNRSDYPADVIRLLEDMDVLARLIQKRRLKAGQVVLELPVVKLVLDDQGKVVDAKPEDTSFTHTIIEMFMVEANEAVARLLSRVRVPFLRRTHPGPGEQENTRLREFMTVAGFKIPKELDRKAIQALLLSVRGTPQSYAINLAVLKSLTRAQYSPEEVGHFALASEDYCHYTSPIRRYADLTIHRLLEDYLEQASQSRSGGKHRFKWDRQPTYDDCVELGRHISFTERRSEDSERELRQVKVLSLLAGRLGEFYRGVITGITNFGVFIQLETWLVEGLVRYERLLDDWWEVNEHAGVVRGQRTGVTLRMGDVVQVRIASVNVPRRELDIQITKLPDGRSPQERAAAAKTGGSTGRPAGRQGGRPSDRPTGRQGGSQGGRSTGQPAGRSDKHPRSTSSSSSSSPSRPASRPAPTGRPPQKGKRRK